ncbi:unnamed protein product [Rangifer tarandus platyrhynchus]|uniref:Uncharacterized protein n=1 Tax=Rangifer tarandus platyrhynchus TaxID=3082113 RepID=A0AC59YZ07_RANTA
MALGLLLEGQGCSPPSPPLHPQGSQAPQGGKPSGVREEPEGRPGRCSGLLHPHWQGSEALRDAGGIRIWGSAGWACTSSQVWAPLRSQEPLTGSPCWEQLDRGTRRRMSRHVICSVCPSSSRNPLSASVHGARQSTQAGQGQQHLGHVGRRASCMKSGA